QEQYVKLLQQTIEQQKEMLAQQSAALIRQQEQTEKLQAMFMANMSQPKSREQAGDGNPEPKATTNQTPTSYHRKAKEPETFSSGSDKVERFLSEFRIYMELTGLNKESQRRQVLHFLSYLRGPAHDWLKPYAEQTTEDFDKLDWLIEEFTK
ncbi:hypothetical protein V1525DRAFT_321762, partial [Lipomyces kononenkoae]